MVSSGTVLINKKLTPFQRLKEVHEAYTALAEHLKAFKIVEVHVEQLPRNCHIFCHYAVCAAGIAFVSPTCSVAGDIPVSSWQKHVDWNGERASLEAYTGGLGSDDEAAAIGMGLWYVDRKI